MNKISQKNTTEMTKDGYPLMAFDYKNRMYFCTTFNKKWL